MIYAYKCSKCKKVIELVQSLSELGDHECKCGGTNSRFFSSEYCPNMADVLTQTFFDADSGNTYNYSDKDKIAKSQGSVYISDAEAKQEASKNKKHIADKKDKEFQTNLTKGVTERLTR